MFGLRRLLAAGILLLAVMSGPAASGLVLAHVATDHATLTSHAGHGDSHDHVEDHHVNSTDGHDHADHCSAHTHEVLPTSFLPAPGARTSIDLPPFLEASGPGRIERPAANAFRHANRAAWDPGPPDPQRHSILLL